MSDEATKSAWEDDWESSQELCCTTQNCLIIMDFLKTLAVTSSDQFLIHSSLPEGIGAHQLQELHVDVEG